MLHKELFHCRSNYNEPLQNQQHPWENLNITDIYFSEIVAMSADRENSVKAETVNLSKTPIHNGQNGIVSLI